MTTQIYTIELKLDTDDECHAAMEAAMKQQAREFLTVAMMLSGRGNPKVICRTTDAFYDTRDIEAVEVPDDY